jgi:hypothetical protein
MNLLKNINKLNNFKLITSEYKTFKNKKGDEIKFLSIDINY